MNIPTKNVAAIITYYGILILSYFSSYFPSERLWGANWWGYVSSEARIVALIVAAGLPPFVMGLIRWFSIPGADITQEARHGVGENIASAIIILGFSLSFLLFRVDAHFLGDGLTSLSYLASDSPLLHTRELGESIAHIWLKELLPGSGSAAALLSFQILSIASGFAYMLVILLAGRLLFVTSWQRTTFLLGMAVSGHVLLYFGYVEYYSIFSLSVAAFSVIGLLSTLGHVSRWWIIPLLCLSSALHILGVTLVPAALYVLIHNSPVSAWFSKSPKPRKLFLGLASTLLLAIAVLYFYDSSVFFRLAFLPVLSNQFTVDGYTLFSSDHLQDIGNLLLLLVPGLPLYLVHILRTGWPAKAKSTTFRLLLVASVVGAAFIFDPKMGMPRDWNLFAFVAIPLSLLCIYDVLKRISSARGALLTASLMICIAFIALVGRVATQNSVDAAISQFEAYMRLDPAKNAKARSILVNYFETVGDTIQAELEQKRWESTVPEKQMFDRAYLAVQAGDCRRGIAQMRQVIESNPLWQDAWSNIGLCFMRQRQFDSAVGYLDIALGLNPYDAASLSNRGVSYMYLREFDRAKSDLLISIKLDNSSVETHTNLIALYEHLQESDQLLAYLQSACHKHHAPMVVFKKLGDLYASRGRYGDAQVAYDSAISRGLDYEHVDPRFRH